METDETTHQAPSIPARYFAIGGAASKDMSRHNLQGVHVTPNRLEATDGHMAVWVETPTGRAAKAVMTPDTHARLAKVKGAVTLNGTSAHLDDGVTIPTSYSETDFPELAHVVPKATPVITVAVDAALLARVCTMLVKMAGTNRGKQTLVTMSLYDDGSPMRFDTKDYETQAPIAALLMPMRKPA